MFNVIKRQKQGLEILVDSVHKSTKNLYVMERELN